MFSPITTMAADSVAGSFQTTRAFDPATARPKMDYTPDGRPSGTAKLVDGREVYRIPSQYIDDSGVDANVSLSVFTKPTMPIPPLATLMLTGIVRVVPWVRNGRIAWSLTADGVEVVDTATGVIPSKVLADD